MSIETERVVAGILAIENMYFVAKPIPAELDGNLWAFPAGELVGDEDPRLALARVLKSKLNLSAVVGKRLGIFKINVGNQPIELDCYFVDSFTGELTLSTYCACSWLIKESLCVVDLAPPHDLVLQALLISGTSSLTHLRDNLAAAALKLPNEALNELDGIAASHLAH
jgi:hypothetical protein